MARVNITTAKIMHERTTEPPPSPPTPAYYPSPYLPQSPIVTIGNWVIWITFPTFTLLIKWICISKVLKHTGFYKDTAFSFPTICSILPSLPSQFLAEPTTSRWELTLFVLRCQLFTYYEARNGLGKQHFSDIPCTFHFIHIHNILETTVTSHSRLSILSNNL